MGRRGGGHCCVVCLDIRFQLLAKHGVSVRRGRVDIHRDQGIVERFNRTLAERLFGHQYAQEMRLPSGQRSTEWVARLPAVVAALNGEVTRLTGKMLCLWHRSPPLLFQATRCC